MGWKSVAWTACLVPVLAGCGLLPRAARFVVPEDTGPSQTRRGIERDQRRDAREAWQTIAARYPGQALSDEFRDGFLDGYADYLERGEGAQPPAVSPAKYRYALDGSSAAADYYAGFRYGVEVAVASGRRVGPTEPGRAGPLPPSVPFVPKPMPIPLPPPRPAGSDTVPDPNVKPKPGSDDPPKLTPDGPDKPIPPLPKPELPIIKPFNLVLPDDGTKFAPLPVPSDPDRLPAPNPPLPATPLPLPLPLPAPTPVPVPSILQDIPPIPFQFDPPVVPAGGVVLRK